MKKIVIIGLQSLSLGFILALIFNAAFLGLFDRPDVDKGILLFLSTIAASCLIYFLIGSSREIFNSLRSLKISLHRDVFLSFIRNNSGGLLLALVFFCIYTYIGLKINIPGIDTVDNFFDADNTSWIARIAGPGGGGYEMRGPHPFAFFIFRPLGWMLTLLTNDFFLSAVLINTFAGGLVVFFTWVFINNETKNRNYAVLMAGLLGLSTAQIIFGSVVESYIFSAASLVGFFIVIQLRKNSMALLVLVSLITFGITLTNFVQNTIGFILIRPRWREILRFVAVTVSAGIVLSLMHAAWYPSTRLFFLPSEAQAEKEFTYSIFTEDPWRAVGRVQLILRTIFLYSVIAPKPYVFVEEVGGTFPRFNFFKIIPGTFSFSSYDGLGNAIILVWAILLFASGMIFIRSLLKTRKADICLAFVLCIIFNFILHLNYGYEPFLYSPDWTYALVLFVALSLAPFANIRVFHAALAVFLILVAYNQFQFLLSVFNTLASYVDYGI